jgi:hypothetical protein
MLNNLFAFNMSQETPESEMIEFPNGVYDAAQQAWVGADGKLLTCCGSDCCTKALCSTVGCLYKDCNDYQIHCDCE